MPFGQVIIIFFAAFGLLVLLFTAVTIMEIAALRERKRKEKKAEKELARIEAEKVAAKAKEREVTVESEQAYAEQGEEVLGNKKRRFQEMLQEKRNQNEQPPQQSVYTRLIIENTPKEETYRYEVYREDNEEDTQSAKNKRSFHEMIHNRR